MTYKLNPEIEKIESPVILCLPSGERRRYRNGMEVTEAVFDHKYLIESLRAVGDVVEVVLTEITEMVRPHGSARSRRRFSENISRRGGRI